MKEDTDFTKGSFPGIDCCNGYKDCRDCPMWDEVAGMCCYESALFGIGMYEDDSDYDD